MTTPSVLLLSGLGPSYYAANSMAGTLFDPSCAERLSRTYFGGIRIEDLQHRSASGPQPLLRRLHTDASAPYLHLTTWTLESVLTAHNIDCTLVPLSETWRTSNVPDTGSHDLVLVSTTFIWSRSSLATLLTAIREAHPRAPIVLGGQYSNLKVEEILQTHAEVFGVVRGDGEAAIPALVEAIAAGQDFRKVPNLTFRENDTVVRNPLEYIDLDQYRSPFLPGEHLTVPYESMRGCPFSCKFCSFPAASPMWRYKSAEKINSDWREYARQCGTQHVQAYDSTFTTPPRRLRELLDLLPGSGVTWEAFARANAIKDTETVERLLAAHCSRLSLGFESMSDKTLKLMKKQVTAAANRKAGALMTDGGLTFRAAFMVGYPGETPEDYRLTNDYLVHDYRGQFLLNVFSLMDETMPVWQDAEQFGLHIDDPENPDFGWTHIGMNAATALSLMMSTLDQVRWHSNTAVPLTWQQEFDRPLVPYLTSEKNLWVEKLVERLAALPLRYPDQRDGQPHLRTLLALLNDVGVDVYRHGQVLRPDLAAPL
jgi:anaerobic magnesium-protoporphyrin IX monomethyl ester cyclase